MLDVNLVQGSLVMAVYHLLAWVKTKLLVYFFLCILFVLTLSILTFSPSDYGFFCDESMVFPLKNWCGPYGAWISSILIYVLGGSAFFVAPLGVLVTLRMTSFFSRWAQPRRILGLMLFALSWSGTCSLACYDFWPCVRPGGCIGSFFETHCAALGYTGFGDELVFFCTVVSLLMLFGCSWTRPIRLFLVHVKKLFLESVPIARMGIVCNLISMKTNRAKKQLVGESPDEAKQREEQELEQFVHSLSNQHPIPEKIAKPLTEKDLYSDPLWTRLSKLKVHQNQE